MAFIYKITSPSNRVYVGSTVQTINARWGVYKSLKCEGQVKLYRSLKKHGVDKHVFEIICECEEAEMLKLENYYGRLYNVLDSKCGLNCVLPRAGDKYITVADETRRKLSESHFIRNKTYVATQETRDKISKALGGVNHYLYGKHPTETHRQNMSKGQKNRAPQSDKTRKITSERQKIAVLQYDLEGNYIQEWPSAKSVMETLKISRSSICACCKGERKKVGGFVWKYKDKGRF